MNNFILLGTQVNEDLEQIVEKINRSATVSPKARALQPLYRQLLVENRKSIFTQDTTLLEEANRIARQLNTHQEINLFFNTLTGILASSEHPTVRSLLAEGLAAARALHEDLEQSEKLQKRVLIGAGSMIAVLGLCGLLKDDPSTAIALLIGGGVTALSVWLYTETTQNPPMPHGPRI